MFFEQARRDAIDSFDGVLVVVRPLHYRPAPVRIGLWVDEIRASSLRISYTVRDAVETYVRATSVLAAYEKAGVRRWSPAERAWLEQLRNR